MAEFPGRCVLKFVPFPRQEEREKLPRILYRIEQYEKLSKVGKQRLGWIRMGEKWGNVSKVCRYYGISRKTFYKWKRRYELFGIGGLEDISRAPNKKRQAEITRQEEIRIIKLRKENIRYGPKKLAVIYQRIYGEKISSWKIYRVIREYGLYYSPVKNEKLRKRRKLAESKKRITELRNKEIEGLFFQLDTKLIWCYPDRRYIFSAVEKDTKIGYSRMYKSNSSANARDFLLRLYYLVGGDFKVLQTDNGSEFGKHFEDACKSLNLEHYFSRVRTPNDHPEIERYNRTIEEEFLQMGNYIADTKLFNELLTEWLIEYNFRRPHQSLGYETPIEFLNKKLEENGSK
ncbi:MAG: integrase core domain-containing protein, partial [Candidatus Omnitrophica bacterium]|nr:integrase core domain-containing protein [Candidatus Omnitrophota bacterium]